MAFNRFAPLHWALLLSLFLHIGLLGWGAGLARMERETDIDSLRVVQVDPEVTPPPPPQADASIPMPPPPALPEALRKPELEKPLIPQMPPSPQVPRRRVSPRPPESPRRATAARPDSPRRTASAGPRRGPAPRPGRRLAAAPRAGTGKAAGPVPSERGDSPTVPASGSGEGAEGEWEDVPEGPVDLEPVKGENGVMQLTPITQGALHEANPNEKGNLYTVLARATGFNGPGVFYTTTLNVPASAPPGTVYQLEFTNVVLADENAKKIPFTPISGTLTVVPTKSPLPPVEQPSLSGATIGIGHLYAHRGTQVGVQVYAGDGLKGVLGVQAKIKFSDVKVGKRRKPKSAPSPAASPPSASSSVPTPKDSSASKSAAPG